ncbi:hypothetical protein ACS0TY_023974 [Phlomoides rotata]
MAPTWSWIWGLQVPPKLQVFIWRCFKDILPVCANLIGRYVDMEPYCKCCGKEVETIEHALRDCEWAREFWATSSLNLNIRDISLADTSIGEWLTEVCHSYSSDEQCSFISLMWSIWFARNKLYFEEVTLEMGFIQVMAANLTSDYRKAAAIAISETGIPIAVDSLNWFPPLGAALK